VSLEACDRRAGYVDVPDARRRGDRIAMFYAAVNESAFGTKQTSMRHRLMSAFGGKADIASMTTMSVFDPKRTFHLDF
jgi:hypothetical protein